MNSPFHSRLHRLPGFFYYTLDQYALLGNIMLLTLLVGNIYLYTASFFTPKTVQYSLTKTTCFTNPILVPKLATPVNDNRFAVTTTASVSIAGKAVYSAQTCITPTAAPLSSAISTLKLQPFGVGLVSKQITVKPTGAPKVATVTDITKTVATNSQLLFELSQNNDQVFGYTLASNRASSDCRLVQGNQLVCDLLPLKLAQGKPHDVTLTRTYQGRDVETITKLQLTTIEPLVVTSATISAGQRVQTIPTTIDFKFSKQLAAAGKLELNQLVQGAKQSVKGKLVIEGASANYVLDQPLPRGAAFEMSLTGAEAIDKSTMDEPFVIAFTTSGGPLVTGTNLASYKTSSRPNTVIYFDVGLLQGQVFSTYVSIVVGTTAVSSTITAIDNTITITPTASLAPCTTFSVLVGAGLVSKYSVGGGIGWKYESRTTCQTVTSIGASVLGAQIQAYSFGTGPSKLLYVGGLHGTERSSVSTLQSFIDDLELNATKIPAGRTIVVLPNANPDGVSARSRLNAHGIDLNRNFATSNWATDVYVPINSLVPGGGGSAPFSEPESLALAHYIGVLQPRLVLTYHANADVVISNDAADSYALAQLYGSKSGYSAITNAASDAVFSYPSTGELEDWLADNKGIPSLLIELSTLTNNEFKQHKNALWAMVQIP